MDAAVISTGLVIVSICKFLCDQCVANSPMTVATETRPTPRSGEKWGTRSAVMPRGPRDTGKVPLTQPARHVDRDA